MRKNLGRLAILFLILGPTAALAQYYNLQGFWKNPTNLVGWNTYSPSGAPTARGYHTAIWTGSKMIVWGGENTSNVRVNTGGIYDPVTNSWATVTTTGAPVARRNHSAIWTGTKMIVFGGYDGSTFMNSGGVYDPSLDAWTSTTTTSAPTIRAGHTAVWTGMRMIVWGGGDQFDNTLDTGGLYDPIADSWTATSLASPPRWRRNHTAVWTGTKMVVWGGAEDITTRLQTGGQYDPAADSWSATSTTGAPVVRSEHTAVWTGSEMIIWGGLPATATGGRYNPSTNSWTATTNTGAPNARKYHQSVWTGEKMVTWGGSDGGGTMNTGSIYDPVADSWSSLTTSGAPSARDTHTAVWANGTVLIWGDRASSDTNVYTYTITTATQNLTVAKVYPVNGGDFMKYVKGANGGTNLFNHRDVACAGNETGVMDACIHGGDKLKVQMPGFSSCKGMTMTDALGAFEWACYVETGNVTFYSPGFKADKGLSDIIDFTGLDFLANSVTAQLNGVTIGTSASAKWWNTTNNPIVALPSSSGTAQNLSGYTAGTILVGQTSANSKGLNINQDRLAIVMKNGTTLTYNGTAAVCNDTSGEVGSPTFQVLICAGSQKYLWIEGTYAQTTSNNMETMLGMIGITFSRFNKLTFSYGPNGESIWTSVAFNYNTISGMKIQMSGNVYDGLSLNDADYNRVSNIINTSPRNSASGGAHLVYLGNTSDNNVLHNISVNNNDGRGFEIEGTNNIVTKVIASGTSYPELTGSRTTLTHMTSFRHSDICVNVNNQYTTINNLFCSDGGAGLNITGASNTIISNLAVTSLASGDFSINTDGTTNTKFTNNVVLHSTASSGRCYYGGGNTNGGFVGTTCGNQGTSDATWSYYTFGSNDQFVGLISTNDVANPSDSSGSASVASITDFYNFDNEFRVWRRAPLDLNTCGASAVCQIFDMRLKSTDTLFRNTTNNGSTQNAAFTAGSACPAAVSGNKTLTNQNSSPSTFLVNAIEIMNDGYGDDDGLCESNEACIYTPNFGAYQGEGNYKTAGTCIFQNGTVKDVQMYAYPTNGG